MGLLNFTAAPIDPQDAINQKNLRKAKKAALKTKSKTNSTRKRTVDPSAEIYGDELFQAAMKTEKAIVLKFHPLDSSYLRMETGGRYAIRYFDKNDKEEFMLYRFLPPIENFEWVYHPAFETISTEKYSVKTYGPFTSLEGAASVKEKLMGMVRQEFLQELKEKKEALAEAEKLQREIEGKQNEQRDELDEQLATAGISDYQSSGERSAEITQELREQEEQILSKATEEEIRNDQSKPEVGETTDEKPRKIVGFNPDGSLIYGC